MEANRNVMRWGLLGGTFDPIHNGHLEIAREACLQFNLDQVIFIPAGQPPHKLDRRIASYRHRYNMTKLALEDYPEFAISDLESHREGPSYTIDTIRFFISQLGSEAQIYFITGADTILELPTWKEYHQLLKLCYFIAAPRPGYILDTKDLTNDASISPELKARVLPLKMDPVSISSTEIRMMIREEVEVNSLVPPKVANYIIKNNLYQ